jgi:hypothetical protein
MLVLEAPPVTCSSPVVKRHRFCRQVDPFAVSKIDSLEVDSPQSSLMLAKAKPKVVIDKNPS